MAVALLVSPQTHASFFTMFGSTLPRILNYGGGSRSNQPQVDQHPHNSSSSSTTHPQQPPRSNFKSALEHIAVPEAFYRGLNVFKVNAKGKLEPVTLTISKDKFIISVLPRTLKLERSGSNGGGGGVGVGRSSSSSLLIRPGILSRGRSNNNSIGSTVGSGSIGTLNSIDGFESVGGIAGFSLTIDTAIDIGSIDRIQSGQNTLLFEKARWVNFVAFLEDKNLFILHLILQLTFTLPCSDNGTRSKLWLNVASVAFHSLMKIDPFPLFFEVQKRWISWVMKELIER